jgi:hypothetical protein
MKSFKPLVLTTLTLLLVSTGSAAQTVYRCGSSYSQTPCANALAAQTDDARTDGQRAAAKQGLAQDKALAKEMEAARLKEEARARAQDREALARAAAEHKKQEEKVVVKKTVVAKPRTVKVKEPEFFTATDGAGNAKKKKATGKSAKP